MRMTLADRRRRQRRHKDRLRRLGMMPHPKAKVKTAIVRNPAAEPKRKPDAVTKATAAVARAAGLTNPASAATRSRAALATPAKVADEQTSLADIGLPDEVTARLDDRGVTTIGHIKGWTAGALQSLGKGVNAKSIPIIRARLADQGHALKGEELGQPAA